MCSKKIISVIYIVYYYYIFVEYIEALMGLEEDIQHDVMNAIQEVYIKVFNTNKHR